MKLVIRLVLLVVIVFAAIGLAPQTERAEAAVSCDVLHISGSVYNTVYANPVYRINGSGPGLPTAGVAVPYGEWTDVSWIVYGPGSWEGLYLEYSNGGSGTWSSSNATPTWGCSAVGCDANITIPSTAVGGTITDNAAVFGDPDPGTMTDTVLEVGKTFWMDGVDSTGMYRKVLISCTWAWVEAAKTGPNYDDVWNGTPLPGHTVD